MPQYLLTDWPALTLNMSDQTFSSLSARLTKAGQAHVLTWWEELDQEGRDQLAGELEELDLEEMEEMYRRTCVEPEDRDMSTMQPVEASLCESVLTSSQETLETYTNIALTQAAKGRVGVLLLAGGMGTRLGVGYPKGMYNIGLPSNKTLYQIQIERILRLQVGRDNSVTSPASDPVLLPGPGGQTDGGERQDPDVHHDQRGHQGAHSGLPQGERLLRSGR